jgi:cobalamin biosynthetic protein CobC
MMPHELSRDHGGGLDAARARYGGARADWVDLSTGINPVPYPVGDVPAEAWTALPDRGAFAALEAATRRFWNIPDRAVIVPAAGASALIARLPQVVNQSQVVIEGPTYNEHAAAFRAAGYRVLESGSAPVRVVVHPNNPDGRIWVEDATALTIIDESFCDVMPGASLVRLTDGPGAIVLKSFGKFWGLAGIRLGFAIGQPETLGGLAEMLGPWAVSGPALYVGTTALGDIGWAKTTRARLAADAARLDELVVAKGATLVGGTDLFRLYDVADASAWQDRLARGHVWSRVFPYSGRWLRLGLPAPEQWSQVEAAL